MQYKGILPSIEVLSITHQILGIPYFRVRRARGNRLYDNYYNIILDFVMGNGTIFMGYKPKNLLKNVKNHLNKGVFLPAHPEDIQVISKKLLQKLNLKNEYKVIFLSLPQLYSLVNPQELIPHIQSTKIYFPLLNLHIPYYFYHGLRTSVPTLPYLLLGPSCWNGYPKFTLIIHNDITQTFNSVFPFQNISFLEIQFLEWILNHYLFDDILTLEQWVNNEFSALLEKVETGIFSLNHTFTPYLTTKLLKQCIFILPNQNFIALTQSTAKEDIRYFVHQLSHILENQ